MQHTFTFTKQERLCGEIRINRLFATGRSFLQYPFRVVYALPEESQSALPRILISVPRKKIRKATDRNRIKRLTREAYRKNKHILLESTAQFDKNVQFAVVFLSDQLPEYELIETKMKQLLLKLRDFIETEKSKEF
jgi:ribonuclease P protein component